MSRVLLLAGTSEARQTAHLLHEAGVDTIASLAGVTRDPAPYACPVRTGGFGGSAGLAAWLREKAITVLIDATHPFARHMPHHAHDAARRTGIPRLRLLRAPWPIGPDWHVVETMTDAVRLLPPGARPFLTTGQGEIDPLRARTDLAGLVRSIEPVADLPAHLTAQTARPPFTRDEETGWMRSHRATHLVTRNAGGPLPAKIAAAGALGLGIIVIARPAPPGEPVVETPAQALHWVLDRL